MAFERRALSLGALQPLRSSAIAAVRAGETSLEEVARVLP